MPYAMTLGQAVYNGGSAGDYTATLTVNVYDATGWARNPDGSYVAPNPLPATPYATTQIVVHHADGDKEALALAAQAAALAVKAVQEQAVFTARTAKYAGVALPVPGV